MLKIQKLNLERKSFKMKNDYLFERFQEVNTMDFYRDIFPVGSFERQGCQDDLKANGILTVIGKKQSRNRIIFDDLEEIKENLKKEFVITSCVSYSGRRRTAKNARWLYGITVDLDYVDLANLNDFFYQIKNGFILNPTYVCNSGHGIHIYYIFKKPIALYPYLHDKLRLFKYEVIAGIWNPYTSSRGKREDIQYQGIFQGFRIPGTQTKLGKQFLVRAFKTGEKIDILDLNKYLFDKEYMLEEKDFKYKSELSLYQAKQKYPEWYEKRIVKKEQQGRWVVKRDLYDWWLKKIKEKAKAGHRYSCLTVLVSYAIKCNISKKEVKKDCMHLLPELDALSDTESNRFTERDVRDALKFYDESFVNYSRKEAERVSGISMPANKRNFQKQEYHLEEARMLRDLRQKRKGTKWTDNNGRPAGSGTKEEIVKNWRKKNPTGNKYQCQKETKLSKMTVYKWW